ncbi:ATP-binding protein [Desulfonatronovibrio magnus]|uniref:ATP-binding protein n=1 Tax=Desulfonatronovibrio magnus TaxID=698827 RepID=UPI0005EAD575|nr:ATP-binding protein [Desulfonatronovibrio magnus]
MKVLQINRFSYIIIHSGFQKFFLVTGLGLILCKQFIEQYGGKIWIESEPGQGTAVSFTLPLA